MSAPLFTSIIAILFLISLHLDAATIPPKKPDQLPRDLASRDLPRDDPDPAHDLFEDLTVTLTKHTSIFNTEILWARLAAISMWLTPQALADIDGVVDFYIHQDRDDSPGARFGSTGVDNDHYALDLPPELLFLPPIVRLIDESKGPDCRITHWQPPDKGINEVYDSNNHIESFICPLRQFTHVSHAEEVNLDPEPADLIPASFSKARRVLQINFASRPIKLGTHLTIECRNLFLDFSHHGNQLATLVATYTYPDPDLSNHPTSPATRNNSPSSIHTAHDDITNDGGGDLKRDAHRISITFLDPVTEPISRVFIPVLSRYYQNTSDEPILNMRTFELQMDVLYRPFTAIFIRFSAPILRKSVSTEPLQCTTGISQFFASMGSETELDLTFPQPIDDSRRETLLLRCEGLYLDFDLVLSTPVELVINVPDTPSTKIVLNLPPVDDDGSNSPLPGPFCKDFRVNIFEMEIAADGFQSGTKRNVEQQQQQQQQQEQSNHKKQRVGLPTTMNKRAFELRIIETMYVFEERFGRMTLSWTIYKGRDILKTFPLLSGGGEKRTVGWGEIQGKCQLNVKARDPTVVDTSIVELESPDIVVTFVLHRVMPERAEFTITCPDFLYLDFSNSQDVNVDSSIAFQSYPETFSSTQLIAVQDLDPDTPLFSSVRLELQKRYTKQGDQIFWTRIFDLFLDGALSKIDFALKFFAPYSMFSSPLDGMACYVSFEDAQMMQMSHDKGWEGRSSATRIPLPTQLNTSDTYDDFRPLPTIEKTKWSSIIFQFAGLPIPVGAHTWIMCSRTHFLDFQRGDLHIPRTLSISSFDEPNMGHNIVIEPIDDSEKEFSWDFKVVMPIRSEYQSQLRFEITNIPKRLDLHAREPAFFLQLFFENALFLQQSLDPPLERSIHNLTVTWRSPFDDKTFVSVIPLFVGPLGQIDPIEIMTPTSWVEFTIAGLFSTFSTENDVKINFSLTSSNARTRWDPSEVTELDWSYNSHRLFGRKARDKMNGVMMKLDECIAYSSTIQPRPGTLLESGSSSQDGITFRDLNFQPLKFLTDEEGEDDQDEQEEESQHLPILDLYFAPTHIPLNLTMTLITNSSQTPETAHLPSFWYNSTIISDPKWLNCTIPAFPSNSNTNNNNNNNTNSPFDTTIDLIVPVQLDSIGQQLKFKFDTIPQLATRVQHRFRLYCPDIGIMHHNHHPDGLENDFLSFTIWGQRGDWSLHPTNEQYYSYSWISSLKPPKTTSYALYILIASVSCVIGTALISGAWLLYLCLKKKKGEQDDDDDDGDYDYEDVDLNVQHAPLSEQ